VFQNESAKHVEDMHGKFNYRWSKRINEGDWAKMKRFYKKKTVE